MGTLAEASGSALWMLHDIGRLRQFDSQTHEIKGEHLVASWKMVLCYSKG
jgi:hypothetical protein